MNISLSIGKNNFLSIFKKLDSFYIDEAKEKEVKNFILPINSKEFDYERLKEVLLEPLIGFCISRKTKDEYIDQSMTLSKKVRSKLRNYINNKGELGEFLLYCFLETDLEAPKILSKLEMKTAVNDYVKGADGIHYKKIGNEYFLIFGEAKMYKNLTSGIDNALKSISDFKLGIRRDSNGNELERDPQKYGISYDRSLIADNLDRETFSEEEKEFLEQLIVPTKNEYSVNHAFAVFVGYEVDIEELKELNNTEFKLKLDEKIKKEIKSKEEYIKEKIKMLSLTGHNFHFYFLPFTELDKNREEITKFIQN